jgi:predicted CXXCH cytochrome family protein
MKERMMVLIVLVAAAGMMIGVSSPVLAVSGRCDECHTMHNSQNGDTQAKAYLSGIIEDSDAALPHLLKADCIGCHAGTTSTPTNTFPAPIVLHTTDPQGQGNGNTLAGGDFYWVADTLGEDSQKGHNVLGLSSLDDTITINPNTPPGWDPAATAMLGEGQIADGADPWPGDKQLTCAGKYGCHGNHEIEDSDEAIRGAHHSNLDISETKALSATTIGSSYRFLLGIKGKEEVDWNWNETTLIHNEYFGRVLNQNYGFTDTISYSCAQCHGVFHSDIATAGGWIRHPTDRVLPITGEYSHYTQYSVEAPVARDSVYDAPNSVVRPGFDIVMCLSCHRAHGSPEPDILRWDYQTMQAGGGGADTGCFTCHTEKN